SDLLHLQAFLNNLLQKCILSETLTLLMSPYILYINIYETIKRTSTSVRSFPERKRMLRVSKDPCWNLPWSSQAGKVFFWCARCLPLSKEVCCFFKKQQTRVVPPNLGPFADGGFFYVRKRYE